MDGVADYESGWLRHQILFLFGQISFLFFVWWQCIFRGLIGHAAGSKESESHICCWRGSVKFVLDRHSFGSIKFPIGMTMRYQNEKNVTVLSSVNILGLSFKCVRAQRNLVAERMVRLYSWPNKFWECLFF